jgi:trehalose-phosphatase
LLLDVDGTIAPIVPLPALARVPDETRRAIGSLVAQPGVVVVLVSGRAAHDARRVVGVDGVWTVGNHGAEVINPNGEAFVHEEVARYANAIADAARVLEPMLAALRGVVLENKKWTLSVHYRGADEAVLSQLREVVEHVAADRNLHVTTGKKVFEIRPPVRVDKGSAIASLVRDLGAAADGASILFAGDDATDEDAFRLLRGQFPAAVTIHVGTNVDTAAEFRFGELAQVRVLLEHLARDVSASR